MSFNELFGLWEAKCNLDILKPLAWFATLKTRKLGLEFFCTSPGIFRECLSFGKVTFSAFLGILKVDLTREKKFSL